ncbi:hypothetical protein B566_EDAN009458 [Ephemera danica]|nr:hypothetical protein B566_EDAN009458 [Ephemera danica]
MNKSVLLVFAALCILGALGDRPKNRGKMVGNKPKPKPMSSPAENSKIDPKFCMQYSKEAMDCCPIPDLMPITDLMPCIKQFPGPQNAAMMNADAVMRKGSSGEETVGHKRKTRGAKEKQGSNVKQEGNGDFPPCPIDCYFNSSGFYDSNGNIDVEKLNETLLEKPINASEEWHPVISTAITKCATDVREAAESHTASPDEICKSDAKFFMVCFYKELVLNCVPSVTTISDMCEATMNKVGSCDPFYELPIPM